MRFIQFLLACLIIEVTPGPNMSYLASVAMARGSRAALGLVAGVASGLAVAGVLAAFGLTGVLEEFPLLARALKWAGVAFMVWLAIEAWRSASVVADDHDVSRFGLYWRGLATNLLNPKSYMFYIAVLPDFIDVGAGRLLGQNLTLVAIYVALASVVHTVIVLGSSAFGKFFMQGPAARLAGKIMAVSLLGVAAWLAVEAVR